MKNNTKKKTFVLTVSKSFLGNHPKKGEPTGFKQKIKKKQKIHTIRGNFTYWKRIIEKVNAGEAILSVRHWAGRPYHKDENGIGQIEIAQFTKLGYQKVKYSKGKFMMIGNELFTTEKQLKVIAENDGLTTEEFKDWFPNRFIGIIIHFTDFKY